MTMWEVSLMSLINPGPWIALAIMTGLMYLIFRKSKSERNQLDDEEREKLR